MERQIESIIIIIIIVGRWLSLGIINKLFAMHVRTAFIKQESMRIICNAIEAENGSYTNALHLRQPTVCWIIEITAIPSRNSCGICGTIAIS